MLFLCIPTPVGDTIGQYRAVCMFAMGGTRRRVQSTRIEPGFRCILILFLREGITLGRSGKSKFERIMYLCILF